MYINTIHVDQVALAWSLADSVRKPRIVPESMSRKRMRRAAATASQPVRQLARWLIAARLSLFGIR